MRLYLLPGLGADPRIFNELDCDPSIELICLDWIAPEGAKDLVAYAAMLHAHYQLEPPYALGGVSLGGMLAQEWAKLSRPEWLVLISTATSRDDMATLIRMAAGLHIGPLLSKPLLTTLGVVGDRFTKKSPKARALFLEMLQKSNAEMLSFGAAAVLDWQPPGIDVPALRIHGSADLVFPLGKWEGCKVLQGGNHFMIFDRGKEIGEHISDFHREMSRQ